MIINNSSEGPTALPAKVVEPAGSIPTVSLGGGIVRLDWVAGPCASSTKSPTVVSFTDFRAEEQSDLDAIFATGIALAENWPIMHGAVGLWLWGKPA